MKRARQVLLDLVTRINCSGKSDLDIIKVLENNFSNEIEESKKGLDESDYLNNFIIWSRDSTINYMCVSRIDKCVEKDKYSFSGPILKINNYNISIGNCINEGIEVFSIFNLPRVLTREDLKKSVDNNLDQTLFNLKLFLDLGKK